MGHWQAAHEYETARSWRRLIAGWQGGFGRPTRHPPTHAQPNRPYLQTRSRRPRTTTHDEYGHRENAQTTRVRSETHRTARTDFLKFFSPTPPDTHNPGVGAPPQIKRPWREKDITSATAGQK